MSTITACPSCSGQLRVPDELLGRLVRCPVCQGTFTAAAANGASPDPAPARTEEAPLWKQLSLDLDGGQPAPPLTPTPLLPPKPAPAGRPGLKGAVELKGEGEENAPPAPRADEPPPRRSGSPPPPKGRRIERDRDRDRDDDEDDDRRPRRGRFEREERRRDTEPHRGALILVLGIISIASNMVCVFVALPLGIVAWVMGHNDLRKMKAHEMDDEGLGMTQAGWVCGIVGTVLGTLVLLSCVGYFGAFLWAESMNVRPVPSMQNPPAPVQQQPF